MNYEALAFWLQAVSVGLSSVNSVCVVVLFFGNRNRATRDAIDRVERLARELNDTQAKALTEALVLAKSLHGEQEARLVRMETEINHVPTRKHLEEVIGPIYDLVRRSEALAAKMDGRLEAIEENWRDLRQIILSKGLEK